MAIVDKVEKFREFIDLYCQKELGETIKKGRPSIYINFSKLNRFNTELAEMLLNTPSEAFEAFEDAVKQANTLGNDRPIKVRVKNLPKTTHIKIKDLRSKHLGLLISVEGLIRQASDIRPQTTLTTFECPGCNTQILVAQTDSKLKEPARCNQCSRKGRFRRKEDKLVDVQGIVLEESPEALEGGEQPKRIRAIMSEDLLDPKFEKRKYPGNNINIAGILKEVPITTRTGAPSTKYDLVIEINSIETIVEEFADLEISKADEKVIKELSRTPNLHELFINSVAPSIYGYPKVKEAIVFQLFGGVKKRKSDGTQLRGDIHLFLVGDPGAGKSILLRYVTDLAPKARYIAGRGASAAGITASVVKDEFMGGWTLEAGTLVLANKGIACIDELDKMSTEDSSSMHEAMEQQTVSISKANIQATLKTETSVLAAANPKFGRFDPYSPIPNQINMPSSLLNRFDLIFTFRDVPNKKADEALATHVLDLQGDIESKKGDIDRTLLRKYVAYARKYCNPVLTAQAKDEIKKYYVKLRNSAGADGGDIKSIPISPRQLQALVRLAEASAKIRLSKKVSKEDAQRAITLLNSCMAEVGTDPETGKFDVDMITSGISATKRNRISTIKKIIDDLATKFGKQIPITEIISAAEGSGLEKDNIEEIIRNLKRQGDIFEPKQGMIQKVN